MNTVNEFPADLLGKYFSGEATAEEAMVVDDWRNTPENTTAFEQMHELWYRISSIPPMLTPAVRDSWAELEPQLQPVKKPLLRRVLLNRYAMAAVIAGVAVLLTVLWYNGRLPGQGTPAGDEVRLVANTSSAIKKEALPDSSHIVFKPGSSLVYGAGFNTTERQVMLTGEAFFDVAPNKTKPFVINMKKLHIKVVGTAFNVKEWQDSSHIEVQVQSGVVKMYTTDSQQYVQKGQTGLYNTRTGQFSIKDSINVNSFSYATRHFSFNNLSLREVCDYIEMAYDVQIILHVTEQDMRLSGEFMDMPLRSVMDMICTHILGTVFEIDGHTVYVSDWTLPSQSH